MKVIESSRAKARADAQRIFILRPDNLGDLVLFSGSLRLIRQHWPSAHITLCVRSFGKALFEHCPFIDEIFPFEELRVPFQWMRPIPGLDWLTRITRKFVSRIILRSRYLGQRQALQCDLAILPLSAPRRDYHAIMDLLPARTRLGIRGNRLNQSRWSDHCSQTVYTAQMESSTEAEAVSEMAEACRFLSFLGIPDPSDLWPEFWTTQADQKTAAGLIGERSGNTVLGLAPGVVSNPGKNLPARWFAEVIESLKTTVDVVLLGSAADSEVCQQVSTALARLTNVERIRNLAGRTTILEMIETCKGCDILMAQETAALHIATALRKPIVGLLGGGHFGRFYPWGGRTTTRFVAKQMDCYGCNWKCVYDTFRCIQEIPPSAAAKEIHSLMEGLRIAD